MPYNGWLYEMCGFKSGIPSRYMNVNVGDELTIMANGGGMKSKRITKIELSSYNKLGTWQTASHTTETALFYTTC